MTDAFDRRLTSSPSGTCPRHARRNLPHDAAAHNGVFQQGAPRRPSVGGRWVGGLPERAGRRGQVLTQGCRRAQLKDVLPDALAQKVPAGVAFVELLCVVDIRPPGPFRAVQVVQRDVAAAHMGRLEWVRDAAEAGEPCPHIGDARGFGPSTRRRGRVKRPSV